MCVMLLCVCENISGNISCNTLHGAFAASTLYLNCMMIFSKLLSEVHLWTNVTWLVFKVRGQGQCHGLAEAYECCTKVEKKFSTALIRQNVAVIHVFVK